MQTDLGFDFVSLLGSLSTFLLILLVLYAYFAYALMVIARKTNTPNAWLAWVPIGNLFLMCSIGRKSVFWAILGLIPLLNIIAVIVLFMGMAEARGKSPALGILIIIPIVGLIVPLLLASGEGSAAGEAPAAGTASVPSDVLQESAAKVPPAGKDLQCPKCGAFFSPGDSFCGECGFKRIPEIQMEPPPADRAAAMHQPPAAKSKAPYLAGCAVIIVALGAAGWYFLGRGVGSSQQRQLPQMPQRMAGSLSEFPVDTGTVNPARPTSVVRQSFRGGSDSESANMPAGWLPAGMTSEGLARQASAMTSAAYRTAPGQPAVNVHVIESSPGQSGAARQIASAVGSAAAGSKTTGIQVRSPEGEMYQGYRVQSPQIQVFILQSESAPIVIVIYAPEPSVNEVAERLAANVGNGRGLVDYPEFSNSIGILPANLPAGMELEEMNTYLPEDLGLSAQQISGQLGGEVGAEAQQLISQFQRFVPQRITSGRYRDSSQQHWDVLVGEYSSALKAIGIWFALRLLGTAGMNSVDVAGGDGLWTDVDEGRILVLRAGRDIVALKAPSGASLEGLVELAQRFQY